MASIVIFHSAIGLTAGVETLAGLLRADGHRVLTPDLFDGETFANLADGVRKRDALGIPELMRRAASAGEQAPPDSIYMGFSMGAAAAEFLAVTRPGARGAVLMHAVLPVSAFGAEAWPAIPVQIHTSEHDPWVDVGVRDAFVREAGAELYLYPGNRHLFADESSPDYEGQSAAALHERVRAFVKR